ncbi:AraC family transcriptional regulator [Granulosicoccus antarcticus]|uniref:RCS-specific HTH-type transcriptional activator RclR n=1 Tax=Granulosicoccus antarcticus IMCC3135 TaxID=1192854 RepID=A0A2Z2P1A9_9GAMM|nr:AraC family transcriptional regulator [Granulosicoccus antarcticus]ASJ76291.1 RCS-specific HTH-type transcriptional activator RclR [Granulosicoccus antarcticus IMCC3135]
MTTDVLSDVLRTLRATGTVYFCDQLDPPWEKRYSGDDGASFHQIRRGSCRLESDGLVEHLGPGDLVFMAPGRAHLLRSESTTSDASGHAGDTLLLCGYCTFDNMLGTPLSELFPEVIVIRDQHLQSLGWLKAILDQLSREYLSMRPGTEIVVNRMTEVLIVELIRMNFGQQGDAPLIKALADKYISKALQRLHQHPEKSWSLELLAADVGLSRAAFAKRFKTLVGQPMFDYLTQLRMQQAGQLLAETDLPLYEVANRVGYESDLAFTRTFKKRLGVTPTLYRKQISK